MIYKKATRIAAIRVAFLLLFDACAAAQERVEFVDAVEGIGHEQRVLRDLKGALLDKAEFALFNTLEITGQGHIRGDAGNQADNRVLQGILKDAVADILTAQNLQPVADLAVFRPELFHGTVKALVHVRYKIQIIGLHGQALVLRYGLIAQPGHIVDDHAAGQAADVNGLWPIAGKFCVNNLDFVWPYHDVGAVEIVVDQTFVIIQVFITQRPDACLNFFIGQDTLPGVLGLGLQRLFGAEQDIVHKQDIIQPFGFIVVKKVLHTLKLAAGHQKVGGVEEQQGQKNTHFFANIGVGDTRGQLETQQLKIHEVFHDNDTCGLVKKVDVRGDILVEGSHKGEHCDLGAQAFHEHRVVAAVGLLKGADVGQQLLDHNGAVAVQVPDRKDQVDIAFNILDLLMEVDNVEKRVFRKDFFWIR